VGDLHGEKQKRGKLLIVKRKGVQKIRVLKIRAKTCSNYPQTPLLGNPAFREQKAPFQEIKKKPASLQ